MCETPWFLISFGCLSTLFSSSKQRADCLKLRIADVKIAAQKSLGQGFLRLIAPDGHVLDPRQFLADAGLEEGDAWQLEGWQVFVNNRCEEKNKIKYQNLFYFETPHPL